MNNKNAKFAVVDAGQSVHIDKPEKFAKLVKVD
jgi:hypothetical protein